MSSSNCVTGAHKVFAVHVTIIFDLSFNANNYNNVICSNNMCKAANNTNCASKKALNTPLQWFEIIGGILLGFNYIGSKPAVLVYYYCKLPHRFVC